MPIVHLDAIGITLTISTLCRFEASSKNVKTVYKSIDDADRNTLFDEVKAKDNQRHSHDVEHFDSGLIYQNLRHQGLRPRLLVDDEPADQECSSTWEFAHSSQDSMTWSDSSQNTFSSYSSYSGNIVHGVKTSEPVKGTATRLEHCSNLVDAALRTMIGGGATIATQGIRLSSDSGGPKIAEIAPALFSPDYSAVGA